jgi:hypothetical protein
MNTREAQHSDERRKGELPRRERHLVSRKTNTLKKREKKEATRE